MKANALAATAMDFLTAVNILIPLDGDRTRQAAL
jgi:hypothetical protein